MATSWSAKCYVIILLLKHCYGGNLTECQLSAGIPKANSISLKNVGNGDMEELHTCLLHAPFLFRISILHSNFTLPKLVSAVPETVRKSAMMLYLNNCSLAEIPGEILTNLPDLLSISFANNSITLLHENSFTNMKKLMSINLSKNLLTRITARTFSDLQTLRELSLEHNRLHYISPDALHNVPVLDVLHLDHNYFVDIPYSAFSQTSVRYWHIVGNRITKITPEIQKLPNLIQLDVQNNSLQSISKELSKLYFLENLHINGNNLTTLPEELSKLAENRSFTMCLSENRWQCDCDLEWLLALVKGRFGKKELFCGFGEEELFCETPRNTRMEQFDLGSMDCNHTNSKGGAGSTAQTVAAVTVSAVLVLAAAVTVISLCFTKNRTSKIKAPIMMIMNGQYYRPRSVADSADTTPTSTLQLYTAIEMSEQQKQTFGDAGFTEAKVYGRLRLGKLIGRGAFGDVFEGMASDASNVWKKVAVKKIRDNASTEESDTLVREYQHLTEIGKHPNIIQVIGTGVINGSLMLVLELAENGDLLAHLRQLEITNRKVIQSLDVSEEKTYLPNNHPRLFMYMWHIARGMEYLSRLKLVHRDLAGRNILLSSGHVAKLSDFGLSRDVYENGYYYQKSNGRLPYKWMSPETFLSGKFTTRSDVWSFGILLWEIVTLGSTPYPGIPPDILQNMHRSGYIIPRPPLCPDYIYSIMRQCWNHSPEKRPEFYILLDSLDKLLQTVMNKDYLDMCSTEGKDERMDTPESSVT